MFYYLYELNHAILAPARAMADATKLYYRNPLNPASHTTVGRSIAASSELFQRVTKVYGKPEFDIQETSVGGQRVRVTETVVWERPFCRLINFQRAIPGVVKKSPKVLIVAPMSGHYATLLRGTVEAMLPNFDIYITDWVDARTVPLSEGRFDLDDYIDYLISISHFLNGEAHIMAVCQPAVPVMAAVAVMESNEDPRRPRSMTLMGGPIDTRVNPTAVNELAEQKSLDWFRRNVIMTVPFPHPGFMRQVYPGFLQLTGFMSMNLDRHITAHRHFFQHLVAGDGDSAEKHREFYDEYNAVMDLTAEFYLQTVDTVFIRHALPKNEWMHRGQQVDLTKIKSVAMLTVEGEKDDISGVGQTEAAHKLLTNLPDTLKAHYMQPGVGHYGVFNGSRFRSEIAPRISDFINSHDEPASTRGGALASAPAPKTNGSAPAIPVTKEAPLAKQAKPAAPKAKTPQAPKSQAVKPAAAKAKTPGAKKASPPAVKSLTDLALATPKGQADDLTAIKGVGPKLAEKLNALGIFHYAQLSQLTPDVATELATKISPKPRVEADDWVGQAKALLG